MAFLGTHRLFASLGTLYDFLIGSFEILAFLVIVAVVIFWIRRNIIRIKRFMKPEMEGWPKQDGNLILYIELVLMFLFLTMNGADYQLQQLGAEHYVQAGSFPISQYLAPIFSGNVRSYSNSYRTHRMVVAYCGYTSFLELLVLFKALTYPFSIP